MLIMALFLVLFSNHMEERLLGGKAVLRVDCRMTDQSDRLTQHDEKKSLLPHGQVIRIPFGGSFVQKSRCLWNVLFCLMQQPPKRSGVN